MNIHHLFFFFCFFDDDDDDGIDVCWKAEDGAAAALGQTDSEELNKEAFISYVSHLLVWY